MNNGTINESEICIARTIFKTFVAHSSCLKVFGVRIKKSHLGIPKSVTQSESAGKNAFLTGFKREVK